MTDAPDLTPEQDAVRRLLADARHDGPTPPAVVARLDDALAALVSERQAAPREDGTRAAVVDLGARRRRTAGIALLAAAAVVVAGVAIGQGLPRMSSGDSEASSAGSADSATSQEREFDSQSGDPGADGSESDSGAAEQAPESLKSAVPGPAVVYPTLSSDDVGLDDDLLDLRSTETPASASLDATRTLSGCDLRGIGPGRRVAAQVDGVPGIVVFRRADGAAQQVELYLCGTAAPVRQLTLPAP